MSVFLTCVGIETLPAFVVPLNAALVRDFIEALEFWDWVPGFAFQVL
jgi:hypothetical protein